MRRLILLFSAFLAANSYAVSGPFQSQRYFKNIGGKFDHISPLLLPTEYALDLNNISFDGRGEILKRNGYTVIQSTSALGPSTHTVVGMGYHNASSGSSFAGVVVGSDVYKVTNSFGSYSKITATTTITLDQVNLAQATSLNDALVFCNEDDQPFYFTANSSATAITTATFQGAKTCTSYSNYLIVANTTETSLRYPSRVRWSDVNTLNSYPALNFIDVEPDDGDFIVSLIQYEDSVYVFKRHSIYRMIVTGSDGPDAFIIRPVVRNNGTWAKNSVKVIPGVGLVFLSQSTIYTLNGSYASQYSENGLTPIGDPIQNTINTINRSQWTHAVGEVYPKRYEYWLSVSTGGTHNDTILVYNYILKAWSVYSDINASAMTIADDSGGNNVLLTGDNHATTYEQDQVGSDNPIGVDTTVPFSYTTPDYTMELPEITKGFKYLYIFSQVDSTTTITITASYDLSTNNEFSNSLQLAQAVPVYDVAVYDVDVYPGTSYRISRIDLNRSARTIRLNFSSSSTSDTLGIIGWTIVYAVEDYKE